MLRIEFDTMCDRWPHQDLIHEFCKVDLDELIWVLVWKWHMTDASPNDIDERCWLDRILEEAAEDDMLYTTFFNFAIVSETVC